MCSTTVPDRFAFLPGFEEFRQAPPENTSLLVLVDTPDLQRAGLEWSGPVMRVDHHSNGPAREFDLVDELAASTANIVLHLLRAWDESGVNKGVALCLYTGMLTDTNGFTVRVNSDVLMDAAWLLDRGLDAHWVADMVYRQRSLAWARLLARALSSLQVEMDGRFAFVVVRSQDFADTGARGHEAESLVDYPFSLKGVVVAAKLQQDGQLWRISLRSKGEASAERIAKQLGGGGHYHAAGAVLSLSFETTLSRLRSAVARELGL